MRSANFRPLPLSTFSLRKPEVEEKSEGEAGLSGRKIGKH